jgi:hypothetical protein
MARIKMTRRARVILYFLEFYVVVMLAFILLRFVRGI